MGNFYRKLEDRYRGSREVIKERLRVYLPFVKPLQIRYPQLVALDIGCGRGEWLELLGEEGFKAKGIDLDGDMLAACKEFGLDTEMGDAIEILNTLPDESVSVISAFHVVEHIAFDNLTAVVKHALRVLVPGGLLILETPNPDNLMVSTQNFYLDPTHLKPIPSLLLSFIVEHYGFERVKTLRLQEAQALHGKDVDIRLMDVLNGASPDYSIVAQKFCDENFKSVFDNAFTKKYGLTLNELAERYDINAHQQWQEITNSLRRLEHDLINSTSWRITAPLRYLKRKTIEIINFGKGKTRKFISMSFFFINRNPLIKKTVLTTLNSTPKLKLFLKKITQRSKLFETIVRQSYKVDPNFYEILARIEANNRTSLFERQLFVDISQTIKFDEKTGIQRVTRSILNQLSLHPPHGFLIEPVYTVSEKSGCFYVKSLFTQETQHNHCTENNNAIVYQAGDIFFGLDLNHNSVIANDRFYKKLRENGVRVKFIVHDLLPIKLPNYFIQGMSKDHDSWLRVVAQNDGAICVSRSVAHELKEWLIQNSELRKNFQIDWFHLGADIESSIPSKGKPKHSDYLLNLIASMPSFLMVGTIEPRKGHAQVLSAFDILWRQEAPINLVIVGKQGWMVNELAKSIKNHLEWKNHLIWIEDASDEYLEEIYSKSTCLIAASEGEGFGLPLIEAAQKNLPIIARDIPVFREVAGDYAFYFSGNDAKNISSAIESWLILYENCEAPNSSGISWLTWKQSTESLMTKLVTVLD